MDSSSPRATHAAAHARCRRAAKLVVLEPLDNAFAQAAGLASGIQVCEATVPQQKTRAAREEANARYQLLQQATRAQNTGVNLRSARMGGALCWYTARSAPPSSPWTSRAMTRSIADGLKLQHQENNRRVRPSQPMCRMTPWSRQARCSEQISEIIADIVRKAPQGPVGRRGIRVAQAVGPVAAALLSRASPPARRRRA